jgi:2-succinyl-5-enolpyruvyl-6-hydroxy-3-cyclohexene-1-carboxylate synthase
MPNLDTARFVIELAAHFGAEDFCVCAGSRNAPLLAVLGAARGVRLFSFVDERSAAYFALGRAKLTRRPVAVVTTSGTAVAELLPAAIEAFYAGTALLLITADRPQRFRHTGAPQTIEQAGIFTAYVEQCVDIDASEELPAVPSWSGRIPLHINVAFDEPLIDGAVPHLSVEAREPRKRPLSGASSRLVEQAIRALERPLLLVGGLQPGDWDPVSRFALRLGAPVYAEPLSGLREDPELDPLLLRSSERILHHGNFDGVIRIGGVPTLRFWRDLEDRHRSMAVVSVSELPFPGLTRGAMVQGDLAAILDGVRPESFSADAALMRRDRVKAAAIEQLLDEEPASEPALVRALSRALPQTARIFLGNSLPVREWDLAALRSPNAWSMEANRGANGIDGEISTFLGQCDESVENWALVGDLTAVYDFNAPWIVRQISPATRFVIAVLNNGGGRIFSRVASLTDLEPSTRERLIENAHSLRFRDWASMWSLPYEMVEGSESFPSMDRGVMEIVVDADATQRFWAAYDALWSER